MNKKSIFIICTLCVGGMASVYGESFLQAASFPKTFADLPFQTRMDVLAEGYAGLETIYDANGRCISGCAYSGITIEKETDAITRNTRLANAAAFTYNLTQRLDEDSSSVQPVVPSDTTNLYPYGPQQSGTSPTTTPGQEGGVSYSCQQYRNARRAKIPNNSPIDVEIMVSSDFGPRKAPTNGATSWHKGIDISVPIGTPIYATADGTIEYIKDQGNKGGGKYVVVKHGDTNFRTSYMHLSNNQVLNVGDKVFAGCLIGISGNTGVSTGPHLHYTVYYTAPGKKFNWSSDAIDPVWTTNYFGTGYRFKSQSIKSCLHNPYNFCADESKTRQVPPETLPGEIR